MAKARWVFTVNNDPQQFYDGLSAKFEEQADRLKYICGQLERGEAEGRLHFQGYLQLKKGQRLSWLKNNISATAHFEPQRGTNNQARDYCRKEDSREAPFIEFGQFTEGRGQRTDLLALRDSVKEGASLRQLVNDDSQVPTLARYLRFYNALTGLYPPTARPREVKLYYGAPGTGKTYSARQLGEDFWELPLSSSDTQWFDGYDNHVICILDDFAGKASKVPLTYTLRLLDKYVVQVPIKGGFTWWNPATVVVTTNIHPRYWYDWDNREVHYQALERRFDEVLVFTDIDEPPRAVQTAEFFARPTQEYF